MKVSVKFHEKDKAVSVSDFEMDAEQIAALLNSKVIVWPLENREEKAHGTLKESYYHPFSNELIVRLVELDQDSPVFNFD